MALASYAIPFGLRQVKLVPLNLDGTENVANAVFLPASRTFSFSETEDFETLEGDDRTVASHGAGPTVDWDLEGGGISLAAWKVLAGGTTTAAGSTPNMTNTYQKKTSDARPYFNAYGRAISDNGGDFEAVVYRCKADASIEGSMENGSFLLTSASGKGYGHESTELLYEFKHRETAVPLANPTAKTEWEVTVSGTPSSGTYTLALNGHHTTPIAYGADATAIAAALNALSAKTGMVGITASGSAPTEVTLPSAGILEVKNVTVAPGTVTIA